MLIAYKMKWNHTNAISEKKSNTQLFPLRNSIVFLFATNQEKTRTFFWFAFLKSTYLGLDTFFKVPLRVGMISNGSGVVAMRRIKKHDEETYFFDSRLFFSALCNLITIFRVCPHGSCLLLWSAASVFERFFPLRLHWISSNM